MKINEQIKNTNQPGKNSENGNPDTNSDSKKTTTDKPKAITENENVQEEKAKEEREKKVREYVQKQFIRVGDKYLKLVFRPDKYGRTQREYGERLKSTIIQDHGSKSLKYIKSYDGFCLVPSHTDFKAEINGWFNQYHQISHIPMPGEFNAIDTVIKHIFGDKYHFAMDYLQLLYLKPTQRLPIILLESKSKNTGKSTFGSLLKMLFEDNSIKLGNSDFESDFNSIWISKLCIIVDETSLDKKGIMQMIKRLSTETNKVTSNEKNKAQTQIDFFGKFFFMSNDEGNALPIERNDTRFAVFRVPTFLESGLTDNPNIEQDMKREIPAFLHFLKNRTLEYNEVGRMYFSTEVYFTQELNVYFDGSRSKLAKAIIQMVNDSFDMFPSEDILRFSASDLLNLLKTGDYISKPDRIYLKKILETELNMKESTKGRYDMFSLFASEAMLGESKSIQQNNRYYEFVRDQFERVENLD